MANTKLFPLTANWTVQCDSCTTDWQATQNSLLNLNVHYLNILARSSQTNVTEVKKILDLNLHPLKFYIMCIACMHAHTYKNRIMLRKAISGEKSIHFVSKHRICLTKHRRHDFFHQ